MLELNARNKVLVTGARGLLGATLMHLLPSLGFDVKALAADVRDQERVESEATAAAVGVNWIVHAAAKTDVAACERNPADAFAVNADGCKNIVNAANALAARVIYISTASIFSGDFGNYRETDRPAPCNVYDQTKLKGERHILDYERGLVLRLNLIGVHPNGSRGKNFFEWLVDAFCTDRDVKLFDDVFINPLSNWSAAVQIAAIMTKELDERVLHIGSKDVLSKAMIGKLAAKRFPNYRGGITTGSVDAVADNVSRPKQMWLNADYASARLSIKMPTLAEEVDEIFRRGVR